MKIKFRYINIIYMFILLSLTFTCAKAGANNTLLYDRIGGYDMISDFSEGLIDGFYSDPRFNRFTEGVTPSISVVERDKQLTTEYLCKITGGPCYYIGKDMLTIHKDLEITQGEWNALLEHAAKLVDNLGDIKTADKKEFLQLFDRISLIINVQKDS